MKTIEPCVLVIFGASGNLSRRKLIPALFRLEVARNNLREERFPSLHLRLINFRATSLASQP